MPTSKLPVEFAPVPKELIELARTFPIYCNLRPEQRPVPSDKREAEEMAIRAYIYDGFFVDPIRDFLKKLTPKTRVAIHFQGYGPEKIGTMVVDIESIYWSSAEDPRLDFEHPKALKRLHGSNFWGSFILAIAAVRPEAELYCRGDKYARSFIRTVKQYGINIGT